ncbi:hypothetical protein SLEP1_g36696 [Rubroshorea leprosula]|uniref:E3 ubiquitin-protein ligase RMA n=1 Tax=Rubroshorea leprosula TaxID=152421 RepID=A0AAV5KSR4_9ROSI|nr:hypothetical protein SLEP1_g36696 [Rubroshorea leprosula]
MANNFSNEIMDLNFYPEPLESQDDAIPGLGSLLNELETAHGRIEDRIRQLEAITSRFRLHQRWTTPNTSIPPHLQHQPCLFNREVGTRQGSVNRENFGKRAFTGAHLIAEALRMENDVQNQGKNNGGFFDCNICLDMAIDPILTCCGHLFCWACYYQLSYAHSDVKECPACEGEVTDTSIIPIYGNGGNNNTCKSKSKESALVVPPRPPAHRTEGIRQRIISRRSLSSIEEGIGRSRNMIGASGEQSQSPDIAGAEVTAERTGTSLISSGMEVQGNLQRHSLQVSRLLLEGAASFSSLSSALNSAMDSAERLVEDLEEFINFQNLRSSHQESSRVFRGDSFPSIMSVIHLETETLDVAPEINSTPLRRMSNFVHIENQITDSAMEVDSASSSRRIDASTVLDLDEEESHGHRRRRLY